MKTALKTKVGNAEDQSFHDLVQRMQDRFPTSPLFTTDAEGLWEAYLKSFPARQRQYHNCSACRHFIRRYGGLVSISALGQTVPALWNPEDADTDHLPAFEAMTKIVKRAKVTGVFLSSDSLLTDCSGSDSWAHFGICQAKPFKRSAVQNAGQAMAEKLEDFKNVQRALEEFPAPLVTKALTLLNTDSLYRSEKVIGPAQFLADLHAGIAEAPKSRRANVVWRGIATAPAGFCHPRSSMIGTLLEDLASGAPFEDVASRFKAKMHPLQYQRPTAAPSAGNIAQAEKVIEQLNAAGSLARRFAKVEEIEAIWRPARESTPAGGVFGHLKTKADSPTLSVPAQTMTWAKFSSTILPTAKTIEMLVPGAGNFTTLITAENADAPPILQWDTEETRNPFSWYVYNGGSTANMWGLNSGTWVKVTAVTLKPPAWFGGNYPHQGEGAIFVLDGAKDSRSAGSGAGLFPEILKSEFHGIRATIEAYSRRAVITGESTASGVLLQSGPCDVRVRVTDGSGVRLEIRLDRWD